MKISKLDPRPCCFFKLLDDGAAGPAVGNAGANQVDEREPHRQASRDDQGHSVLDSEFSFRAGHGFAPVGVSSIFKRDLVSSSHFTVRSLIPRWVRSSRIWSSTSARLGAG